MFYLLERAIHNYFFFKTMKIYRYTGKTRMEFYTGNQVIFFKNNNRGEISGIIGYLFDRHCEEWMFECLVTRHPLARIQDEHTVKHLAEGLDLFHLFTS